MLGIDPGFACTGWVIADFRLVTHHHTNPPVLSGCVVQAGVIKTSAAKDSQWKADSNFRRSQSIYGELHRISNQGELPIQAVCMEAMSFPRSSSTAAKIGMTIGVAASVVHQFGFPVVMNTPQEIRKSLGFTGKKVEWEEVKARVLELYDMSVILSRYPTGIHEHMIDALAAIHCGLESDLVKALIKMTA